MSDPTALDTLDSLRYMLKTDIDAVISRKEDIKAAVDRYYGTADDAVDRIMEEVTSDVDVAVEMGAAMNADDADDDAARQAESTRPLPASGR
jgi:general secretion pathway protein E/type IV pilus assembly protein PilB